jgi:hypothetical protein
MRGKQRRGWGRGWEREEMGWERVKRRGGYSEKLPHLNSWIHHCLLCTVLYVNRQIYHRVVQ